MGPALRFLRAARSQWDALTSSLKGAKSWSFFRLNKNELRLGTVLSIPGKRRKTVIAWGYWTANHHPCSRLAIMDFVVISESVFDKWREQLQHQLFFFYPAIDSNLSYLPKVGPGSHRRWIHGLWRASQLVLGCRIGCGKNPLTIHVRQPCSSESTVIPGASPSTTTCLVGHDTARYFQGYEKWTSLQREEEEINISWRGGRRVAFINPSTLKTDRLQISPTASREIVHHTVWRTWLFIVFSDQRWFSYQFSAILYHSSRGWESLLFNSWMRTFQLVNAKRKRKRKRAIVWSWEWKGLRTYPCTKPMGSCWFFEFLFVCLSVWLFVCFSVSSFPVFWLGVSLFGSSFFFLAFSIYVFQTVFKFRSLFPLLILPFFRLFAHSYFRSLLSC